MPSPDDERAELRRWLHQILEREQLTPTALARRAGIAQSTLTRFLNADDSPMLGTRSITKIRHAVEPGAAPPAQLAEREAEPYEVGDTTATPLGAAIAALIGTRRAADPWLMRSDVLALAGILPGDILIVDLNAAGAARPGDVVCAQDYRASGTETVFRLYEPPFLVAATLDAGQRKPLFVDGDRVVLMGLVTDLLRSRG